MCVCVCVCESPLRGDEGRRHLSFILHFVLLSLSHLFFWTAPKTFLRIAPLRPAQNFYEFNLILSWNSSFPTPPSIFFFFLFIFYVYLQLALPLFESCQSGIFGKTKFTFRKCKKNEMLWVNWFVFYLFFRGIA